MKQIALLQKKKRKETEGSDLHALLGTLIVILACRLSGMFKVIQRRRRNAKALVLMLLQQQPQWLPYVWESQRTRHFWEHLFNITCSISWDALMEHSCLSNTSREHARFYANQGKCIQIPVISKKIRPNLQNVNQKTVNGLHFCLLYIGVTVKRTW